MRPLHDLPQPQALARLSFRHKSHLRLIANLKHSLSTPEMGRGQRKQSRSLAARPANRAARKITCKCICSNSAPLSGSQHWRAMSWHIQRVCGKWQCTHVQGIENTGSVRLLRRPSPLPSKRPKGSEAQITRRDVRLSPRWIDVFSQGPKDIPCPNFNPSKKNERKREFCANNQTLNSLTWSPLTVIRRDRSRLGSS